MTNIFDENSLEKFPVLVEITRSGLVESRHRGIVVVVTPDGKILASVGSTDVYCFLRSSAKPFQAMLPILTGAARHFKFSQKELAILSGSHNGEPKHTECVEEILQRLNLNSGALCCGIHPPFNKTAAKILNGKEITPLHNNCSGKHSGMLATAIFKNFPIENYEMPSHPVQMYNAQIISKFANISTDKMYCGVDGCTVPTWAIPLYNIALAYARLVNPVDIISDEQFDYSTAADIITSAMINYPDIVGGTDRIDTDIMQTLPQQLISKIGADGVQAIGVVGNEKFPDGLGIAVKIEDGDSFRARNAVVLSVLEQLGIFSTEGLIELEKKYCPPVMTNRKQLVGQVQATFKLEFE